MVYVAENMTSVAIYTLFPGTELLLLILALSFYAGGNQYGFSRLTRGATK